VKVRLPPTRESVDQRVALFVGLFVSVQFLLTGLTLVLPSRPMSAVWFLAAGVAGVGAWRFEMLKARRSKSRLG